MVEKAIIDWHPNLRHARIIVLMKNKVVKRSGREVLGQAQKVGKKWQAIASEPYDFLIWFSVTFWYDVSTHRQKVALVDHELCHCKYDPDTYKASIRPHGIEEFPKVWHRHGDWLGEMENSGIAIKMHHDFTKDARGFVKRLDVGRGPDVD